MVTKYHFSTSSDGKYWKVSKSDVNTDLYHILEKRGRGYFLREDTNKGNTVFMIYLELFFANIQPPEHHLFLKNAPYSSTALNLPNYHLISKFHSNLLPINHDQTESHRENLLDLTPLCGLCRDKLIQLECYHNKVSFTCCNRILDHGQRYLHIL